MPAARGGLAGGLADVAAMHVTTLWWVQAARRARAWPGCRVVRKSTYYNTIIANRAPYWIKRLNFHVNFASAQTTHLVGRSGYARCSVNVGWSYP